MHRSIVALTTFLTGASASTAFAQSTPIFTTEDMLVVRTFAGGQPLAVSSDGRRVAYVLTDTGDEWNIQEPRPTGHVVVQMIGSDRPGAPPRPRSGRAPVVPSPPDRT